MLRSRTRHLVRCPRRWPVAANASLLLVGSGLALAMLSLAPRPTAPAGTVLAAVFPPWWSATRSFLAASGAGVAILRAGALPAILVVRLDRPESRARLREAGAWLLLDPQALGGCNGEISS